MTLINEYITPHFAAESVYEFVRKPWTHAFTRMGMSMSSHSFDKTSQSLTCTQTCRIELETYEPFQAYVIRIDVDLVGKEGQITVHGAGIHSQYVFPSDADTLELWLIKFRCFLRKEFSKDKNND